jgi:DNA-binding transcriptional LysR family regulator
MITNIPTDLLRTFIAVVDLRSFTKAAQSLGVTQPAVSAQIKRLQFLLGTDLFDRRSPGVGLTPQGQTVVDHARRLLMINDQILNVAETKPRARRVRIGLPGDLSGPLLPWTLAKFRMRWPDFDFQMFSGGAGAILRDLRQGDADIVIALSHEAPVDACHSWTDQLVWVHSDATKIDPHAPVPMVAFSNECMCYQAGVSALRQSGREQRLVMTASTVLSLAAGVDAGLGTMVMTRGRVRFTQLMPWADGPLPPLPQLHVGIYVREGADTAPLHELADDLAPLLRPKPDDTQGDHREFNSLRAVFGKSESRALGGGG